MSYFGLTGSSGSLSLNSNLSSSITVGSSSTWNTTGSLIYGGTSSTLMVNTGVGWVPVADIGKSEIDVLKELVELLFQLNGIEIDIDEYLKSSDGDRISMIRDIKIKKVLDK